MLRARARPRGQSTNSAPPSTDPSFTVTFATQTTTWGRVTQATLVPINIDPSTVEFRIVEAPLGLTGGPPGGLAVENG